MLDIRRRIMQLLILVVIWAIIITIIHYLSIGVNREGWPLFVLGICIMVGGLIVSQTALSVFRKTYPILNHKSANFVDIIKLIESLNDEEQEMLNHKIYTLTQSTHLKNEEEVDFEELLPQETRKQKRL